MIFINTDRCCGCEACRNVCPVDAIKMVEDREGFLYPEIDKNKCIDCKLCEKVCPMDEDRHDDDVNELYFGAKAKDDKLRFDSSSGGVFPLLALSVINKGGVVFGACLEDNGEVRHIAVTEPSDIALLQKTKYVQSEIGDCFRQVKNLLESGTPVLFTGTPCQCRGLQLFLNKAYDKLLVADLICYGAPSPGVWRKYLSYLKHQHGGQPEKFSFRDKRKKDNGHTVSFVADGTEHTCHLSVDRFCKIYFRNEIIRPSCHSCNFCTPARSSDLTLGDFWGIEKLRPDFDDGMGTSLVIVHGKKGKEAWDNIADRVICFPCTREEAMQPRLQKPTEPSPKREAIMQLYRILPFAVWIRRR